MRLSRPSLAAAMSAVVLAFAAPAFAQDAPSDNARGQDNAEMAAIFAADQAVRQNIDPQKFRDRAFVEQMHAADAARRVQTRALLDAGALKTGADYRAAAFVFQHGSTPEDYLLAHSLAVAAVAKGDADEIVVAQGEDGGDEVVALALVPEEDGQAVGEEGEHVSLQRHQPS